MPQIPHRQATEYRYNAELPGADNPMAEIEFSSSERSVLVEKLQNYCIDELDRDLGNLEAECLLDFIGKEIGNSFYNRALYDAQALVSARAELLGEAIIELEKTVSDR